MPSDRTAGKLPRDFVVAGAHTPHCGPLLLPHCTPVRPRVEAPREMTMHLLPVSPPGRSQVCCPYPLLLRPLICHRNGGAALRSAYSTQSVNTGGALTANKSARHQKSTKARVMLGPPDTSLLHMCGPPRPGVANRPSSGSCCVGLGQGQRGAHRHGSRGQRRVTYQRTRLIKPRPASHGTATAMRARIAGPSITHSSNKAFDGRFRPV